MLYYFPYGFKYSVKFVDDYSLKLPGFKNNYSYLFCFLCYNENTTNVLFEYYKVIMVRNTFLPLLKNSCPSV